MNAPITIALGISHAPWIDGRTQSYERLLQQLGVANEPKRNGMPFPSSVVDFHVERERMPNPEWSELLWTWATKTEASHCLFLQDDIIVPPNFWPALLEMIEAQPDEVIALQTLHPMARLLAMEGERWVTTSDGLVGTGYVWPRHRLEEFLHWRATRLQPEALEFHAGGQVNLTEDTMQGLYCLLTGRRIYHPIPTIIDHDVTLASSYGNEGHANRRSPVTWDRYPNIDIADHYGWQRTTPPRHAGRFYEVSPFMARKWVKDVSDEDFLRMRGDNGSRELRRMNHLRMAKGLTDTPTRLLVCTPIRGGISPGYSHSLLMLQREPALELVESAEIADVIKWQEDLVRVRSRFVNFFLHQSDATHLLFIDSDIIFEPRTIRGMLAAGKDFVTCPYPRRDTINFDTVRQVTGVAGNAVAYRYSMHPLPGTMQLQPGADACVEIAANGLGLTLLTRAGMERMEAHYKRDAIDFQEEASVFRLANGCNPSAAHYQQALADFAQHIAKLARENPDLRFEDESPSVRGGRVPSVALFALMMRDKGLLSEDYSFCRRWRDMGEKVWLYLGLGSPVSHEGEWIYQGALEAFGLARVEG